MSGNALVPFDFTYGKREREGGLKKWPFPYAGLLSIQVQGTRFLSEFGGLRLGEIKACYVACELNDCMW